MQRLEGKVAVVTGASKGIGKAIAFALAEEGCSLAITSRNQKDLEGVVFELESDVRVVPVRSDVCKWQDVQNLARTVESKLGIPQILINNAGIGHFEQVVDMTEEEFRSTLETNLFGAFFCAKAFLPGMIEKKTGHIVNIASLAAKNNFAGGSAYCSSKHALLSFSECLMLEVRHDNIKVTTICPGTVQTTFGRQALKDKTWALTPQDVGKAVVDVLTSSEGSLVSLVDLRPLHPAKR